jgi:SAM-dependent methyltransferase
MDDLKFWLETPRGRLLHQRDSFQLEQLLPAVRGFRMMKIGDWQIGDALLASSNTLRQWSIAEPLADAPCEAQVLFNGQDLPLASKCLDAVILPHSLETAAQPHQLLREVDRVLCDRGRLIITGFNPFSLWALRRRIARRQSAGMRSRRYYSLGRIVDWMSLLDFDLVAVRRYGVGFPYLPVAGLDIDAPDWRRLPALMAQAYVVVARKRVIPLTPVQQKRRQSLRPARGATVAEPTSRMGVRRPAA